MRCRSRESLFDKFPLLIPQSTETDVELQVSRKLLQQDPPHLLAVRRRVASVYRSANCGVCKNRSGFNFTPGIKALKNNIADIRRPGRPSLTTRKKEQRRHILVGK